MVELEVKKSKIQGHGCFLTGPIKKGHIISFLKGKTHRKQNKDLKDALDNSYWVGVAKDEWIDPVPPYRYMNHSCNPSAGIKGKITIVALRDLKAGDELTLDYSSIEGDPRWHLESKCRCGERGCRGVIGSVQSLPRKTFERYLPFVPTYFKEMYIRGQKKARA